MSYSIDCHVIAPGMDSTLDSVFSSETDIWAVHLPSGVIAFFVSEDDACAFQREWRTAKNLDPRTGERIAQEGSEKEDIEDVIAALEYALHVVGIEVDRDEESKHFPRIYMKNPVEDGDAVWGHRDTLYCYLKELRNAQEAEKN